MPWGLRLTRRKPDPISQPPEAEGQPERLVRGESVSTPAELAPPTPPQSPPPSGPRIVSAQPPGVNLNSLRQRILDLYGQRASRDEFSAQAVDLISRTLNVNAAALLAYEQRRDRLVLVGSKGLTPEAEQVLGSGTSGPGWDIPARGLVSRKISVIEAAQQNPFVPRPLVDLSPRRLTIATLPFFHGYAPSGVLVLFANKPRAFSDVQLQSVAQALKVVALAFAELPLGITAEYSTGPDHPTEHTSEPETRGTGVLDRQRAADAEEVARLRKAFDDALWQHAKELAETRRAAAESLQAERDRFAAFGATVAELEDERDRLAAQLATARKETSSLADVRTTLESQKAEAARLHGALATATARAEETTLRLKELEQAHADLGRRHEAAVRRHAEEGEANALERDRSSGTITALRERLERLEAEHAALRTAANELREAHERAQRQLETTSAEAARIQGEIQIASSDRAQVEARYANLQASHAALETRASEAERARSGLQQQLDERTKVLRQAIESLRGELAQALGQREELQRAVDQLQGEVHAAASRTAQAATRSTVLESELASLRREHDTALAKAREERQRLEAELRVWREQEPAWSDQMAQAAARMEASEAERIRLEREIASLQAEQQQAGDASHRRLRELEESGKRWRDQYAQLEARHSAVESAHAAVLTERNQLTTLCTALRAEQQRTLAERDEIAAAKERQIADLQAELCEAMALCEQANGEKSSYAQRLGQEREALTVAHRQLEERCSTQTGQLRRLEQELATSRAQQDALRVEAEQSRARYDTEMAALHGRLTATAEELDALRRDREAALAGGSATAELNALLQTDVNRLRAELERSTATLAAHRAEVAETEERQRVQVEALRNEIASSQQGMSERDQRLDALRGQLAEMTAGLDHERALHRDEATRLARQWEEERAGWMNRSEDLERQLERARKEHRALVEALAADEGQPALEIERCVIPGSDSADALPDEAFPIEPANPGASPSSVAVVDGELRARMCTALAEGGYEVVACEPTEAAVDELATRRLGGIAINVMAGPDGWGLVRKLRDQPSTRSVPMLLYAKNAENSGFCFGPTDCIVWPSEPQSLLDALARLAPRAKRILAMSTDIDVVGAVRDQLTGAGLSAAVMLDGKQALDLLPSVRPDAVVLHLSASCVDVFRTIAGLRSNGNATLPVLFLIDREPSTRDSSFLSGGVRTLANKGTFGPAGIAEAVGRLNLATP
jgi:CheY-like chemotaxis protein